MSPSRLEMAKMTPRVPTCAEWLSAVSRPFTVRIVKPIIGERHGTPWVTHSNVGKGMARDLDRGSVCSGTVREHAQLDTRIADRSGCDVHRARLDREPGGSAEPRREWVTRTAQPLFVEMAYRVLPDAVRPVCKPWRRERGRQPRNEAISYRVHLACSSSASPMRSPSGPRM